MMQTRDTSKLIDYAMQLERENKALKAVVEQERNENARLRELRKRDREIAAHYRALVEKDANPFDSFFDPDGKLRMEWGELMEEAERVVEAC